MAHGIHITTDGGPVVYGFDLLNGIVPGVKRKYEIRERDQYSNFGRRSLGTKSDVFTLRSTVFVGDYTAGRTLLREYAALIVRYELAAPFPSTYALVKDDYNYRTQDGLDLVVLDVQPSDFRQLAAVCPQSSLQYSPAAFLVEAVWRLRFRPSLGEGTGVNVAFSRGFKADAFN